MDIPLRKAGPQDAGTIRRLVRQAGINPTGLDWRRFMVGISPTGEVIGCAQLKPHPDGSIELASLVTHPDWRGQGIARRLVEYFQASGVSPLYLMCRSGLGPFYARFGFTQVDHAALSAYFRRIQRIVGALARLRAGGETLLVMRWEPARVDLEASLPN